MGGLQGHTKDTFWDLYGCVFVVVRKVSISLSPDCGSGSSQVRWIVVAFPQSQEWFS